MERREQDPLPAASRLNVRGGQADTSTTVDDINPA